MSNHRYRDFEARDSIDLEASSASSDQSISVIGALMKRFREAAPAPPGRRKAPVSVEEMWWIDKDKNKKSSVNVNFAGNGSRLKERDVEDFIRESIESDGMGDGESMPRKGLPHGMGRTLLQRHDGGNLPTLRAAGGGGGEEGGGGGGVWQQYGASTIEENSRTPLNPFGQSVTISQLSASQASASGLGSMDPDPYASMDLDAYANELLEKCDAIVGEFRAGAGAGARSEAGRGREPARSRGERSALAEQVAWQSAEDGIQNARTQHLKQAGNSNGNINSNSNSNSNAAASPGGGEDSREMYQVEELDLFDGSPGSDNVHVQKMQYIGQEASNNKHLTSAISTEEDEISGTSVVIFPGKSPKSPPRTVSGTSAYRKSKPTQTHSSRTPTTVGTAAGTQVDSATSKSNQRDSGSVFPLYLSSSGELTQLSQTDLSQRSQGVTSRRGRNTSQSMQSSVNASAFDMVEGEEGEVTVSFDASQILRIPEMDLENVGDKDGGEEERESGSGRGLSPYLEVSQSHDGEVSVRASMDMRLSSPSPRKAVALKDVEAFLEDPVVSHLWSLLCGVRGRIATVAE